MNEDNFSGRLKALLKERGISQAQLAERTRKEPGGEDCSQQLISYLFKKNGEISKYASHWAKILGVSTDWLVAGWEPKTPHPALNITEEEKRLLQFWRSIPEEQKQAWLQVMKPPIPPLQEHAAVFKMPESLGKTK